MANILDALHGVPQIPRVTRRSKCYRRHYSGYDQEESVIMNHRSIDRGLFQTIYYRSYMDLEKKSSVQQSEEFGNPLRESTLSMKHGTYDKLEDDGLLAPGTGIRSEYIIGKTAPIPPDSEELGQRARTHSRRGVSTPLKSTGSGIVDKVLITTNSKGQKFVKVRVRSTRISQIGDKSITNPHAIPSRMTVGHLVECLLSKVATLIGNEGDATPFTDLTSMFLRQKGYQSRPTYYQQLKHMVDDKIHSRARGPVQILTRQPVEGRGRDGRLRLGEMERGCMISHGIAGFLKERLFEASDAYRLYVCDMWVSLRPDCDCKPEKQNSGRRACKNKTAVSQLYIPYAAKLLFHASLFNLRSSCIVAQMTGL
ncbi:DNA-dependent RNA polymerase II [Marasmius sp. AFHP31]|nr:DNA-dependent RNA polymerase II [Marasmius sp. AFHP31]